MNQPVELSSWIPALLNQRFQRFRIDLDQMVGLWQTMIEPGEVVDFRFADATRVGIIGRLLRFHR